jgi:hypothetical protein
MRLCKVAVVTKDLESCRPIVVPEPAIEGSSIPNLTAMVVAAAVYVIDTQESLMRLATTNTRSSVRIQDALA